MDGNELTPEETVELVCFIKEGLGCGCPDEVFSYIHVERKPDAFQGLPIDYLITIGDRLLVAICVSVMLSDELGVDIRKSLVVGRELRDRKGFNRFRLVVTSEEADMAAAIQNQLAGITRLDDNVHLHVVRPSVIPRFLAPS
jgi:hypothetical protein